MRARVPSSTANLGPGFDTLAVALSLSTVVSVDLADTFSGTATGEGSHFALDDRHLAVRIVKDILGHNRVTLTITSDIPVSRGLGSSAALTVAVAAACGHRDPLTYAALLEGHADNAAAAVLGGFVTASIVNGQVFANRLPLDSDLQFVVVVPDRHLSTKEAREALPGSVTFADAVANLGSLGLLIAGMADHTKLVRAAAEDRLHQTYRAALFPEAGALLGALTDAGALVSFWSGAGPTLVGVCERATAEVVCGAANASLAELGVAGSAYVLDSNTEGLVVTGN